jgi:hypothetical protein
MAAHALQALGLQGKTVLEINTLGDPERYPPIALYDPYYVETLMYDVLFM